MHRAVSCVSLGRSGGVVTENPVTETLNFSKPVLGAFLAGTFCTTDTWLADTGANMHIVNDMKWFMKDKFHPSNLKISTADGSTTLKIEGTGVVRLLLRCPDGFQVKVSLSEVAYAPEGKCNLFSGGMFVRKAKVTGVYNEKYMTWIDGAGFTVGHAIFDNGLYHLKATKVSSQDIPDNLIAATIDFDDPVWIWHRRLGHLGFQNMLMLLNSSTGMEITEKQIKAKLKAVCPVCATTRALVKIPRDPATRHSQQPGWMVHVDVWGPYPIEGFDGTRYFLFITDDCTRYTWSARFDKKYQLFEVFKSLVKLIQKAFNITIRCCRFDNEFERGPIGKWCDSHSIAREPIEPYAHYQNGVAERANRTIREKAAPMVQEISISGQVSKIISEKGTELLRTSKIPENLWPEAIQHAVWLKNRTPARALRKKDAKTPYEALRGVRPILTRERIWGSRAYITYPQEMRITAAMTKLHSACGWLDYFVGCESEAIYHIYSPEKHKVFRIGVARVEDGEGLEDLHNAPCLEDRVPTPDLEMPSHIPSGEENEGSDEEDSDQADDQDQRMSEAAHESSYEIGSADDEYDTEEEDSATAVMSKYFNPPRHAGMAKRKVTDIPTVVPRKSRRATHDLLDVELAHSDSDFADSDDDSWYYSDDGKISRAYWQFVAKHGGNHMKTFLPDDGKCDRCFRNGRRCDSAENGIPCSTCRKESQGCRPQSKETRKLILPGNRHKRKEIGRVQQEKPCRRCFQTNRNGAKKSTARQDRRRIEKEARYEKLGFVPVPREQKCYRCAARIKTCDGKIPCNQCETPQLRVTCRPQGLETLSSCNQCTYDRGRGCDRGRPCKGCIRRKSTCTYEAQDGLVSRIYQVPGAPIPNGFSSVGPLPDGEPSDIECVRCQRQKLNCDGEQPCYPCVKAQKTNSIASCNYRLSDGTYEAWAVRSFEVNDLGERTLRTDYEHFTGRGKIKVSQELKAIRDSLETKLPKERRTNQLKSADISDSDASRAEPNVQQRPAPSSSKQFKYGLTAYTEHDPPDLSLKMGGGANSKYHEAKMEELKSHREKGNKCYGQ